MIEIINGNFSYKENIGIKDLNIKISKGTTACILGPNGTGKTTLLKILMGIYYLDNGKYYLEENLINKNFFKNNINAQKFYQKMGFVFQNSEVQLFNVSVYDEIAFGLKNMDLTNEDIIIRVKKCLELFDIEDLKYRVPYHLSGGQQKIVAIASILVTDPEVIILDEPFNGLSPKYRNLICRIITNLKEKGKTVIIATHYLSSIID
ncbi:energy-coupling factor ABC transporter ATP-binding protein, partial [Enterococcus faecium]